MRLFYIKNREEVKYAEGVDTRCYGVYINEDGCKGIQYFDSMEVVKHKYGISDHIEYMFDSNDYNRQQTFYKQCDRLEKRFNKLEKTTHTKIRSYACKRYVDVLEKRILTLESFNNKNNI